MTRSTSAISANIAACVCAAQPVTTMRASGRSRFSRRIDCRACATASLVTAQLLMTMVWSRPALLGLARDHLGFERVEAAAEGDDLDAHATDANSEGSNLPSYSNDAVPVISTWSSRSRHSIASLPPGSVISTLRLARFSRAAATAVAQAAEPQALVSPRRAPRCGW